MDSPAHQPETASPRVIPREPTWFVKAFTVVGFLIATCAVAYILTSATLLFFDPKHKFSLFGIYWGLFARFLQWSVRRGVKINLQKYQDGHVLGEQLFAFPVARRLVTLEIVLSVVFFILGLG
jgi:hypothetical protein